MTAEANTLIAGRRFRLSKLGAQRCPRHPVKVGEIINVLKGRSIRVRFDGKKRIVTLHRDYIEPDEAPLT